MAVRDDRSADSLRQDEQTAPRSHVATCMCGACTHDKLPREGPEAWAAWSARVAENTQLKEKGREPEVGPWAFAYLDPVGKKVTVESGEVLAEGREKERGDLVGYRVKVKPCGCGSRFCRSCGPRLGHALRRKLTKRLVGDETTPGFKAVFGVTLSLDPTLFVGPSQARRYVQEHRCIARFVAALRKRGLLLSRHYFWVMEFQKNNWPHWHLVVEAERIDFGILAEEWSKFRPPGSPPLIWKDGGECDKVTAENYRGLARPGFGSVRFSAATSESPGKAAYYLSKYFTKLPESWPDWVLEETALVLLKGSNGFWPKDEHEKDCFCDECRGEAEDAIEQAAEQQAALMAVEDELPPLNPRPVRTIGERLNSCGQGSVVVQVPVYVKADGTANEGKPMFLDLLKQSWSEVADLLALPAEERSAVIEFTGVEDAPCIGLEKFYALIGKECPLIPGRDGGTFERDGDMARWLRGHDRDARPFLGEVANGQSLGGESWFDLGGQDSLEESDLDL